MAVLFNEEERLFTLQTKNSSYQMKADKFGFLLHLYYGAKIEGSMEYLLTYQDRGFSGNPYESGSDRTYSLDVLPLEYPVHGIGDCRTQALRIKNKDGIYSADVRYHSYSITSGKYSLPGLPAVYGNDDADTLTIRLRDETLGAVVELLYGVFEKKDIITRAVRIVNEGKEPFYLEKAASATIDFLYGEYDLIHFKGRHAMERQMERIPVAGGIHSIGSMRGTSSHQHNPFFIIADKSTNEEYGNCYGFSFVYSGGFKAEIQKEQYGQTRIVIGLQDACLSYPLHSKEEFYAPEVVMGFSDGGFERLSHIYHDIYRNNLCRGKFRLSERPVLLNSWEAAYLDFDGEKIYQTAKEAASLGVDTIVLDDGWFGKRDEDRTGLGDWYVNEKKMGGSLTQLVKRINGLGMKFGLWVEPEMVSEDSDLYRQHPDWAFVIPGRKPILSREQLVLDFSRKEVVDSIYDSICKVLDSANIEYLKWDMNRSIAEVYSACAKTANHGAILYRYMLGLYDFLERLVKRYPDMLIEGCSGGGGRFDAGMLYYTPQIWCSDNTDAIDRLFIQYGTSFGYPVSAVGAHVSAVPNHQTGRIVPMETRAVTAMAGCFGYELDPAKLSEEEKDNIREQIITFKKYEKLIHNGLYYRLSNPMEEEISAWEFADRDKKEALLNVVTLNIHGNAITGYVRMKGLDASAFYKREDNKQIYSGSALMNGGIAVPHMLGEYRSVQIHFIRV